MGTQFNAVTELDTIVGPSVGMGLNAAERVARAIGLLRHCDDGRIEHGGQCTPQELYEMLLRWPDGHPDPVIYQHMSELAQLCRAALRAGPRTIINWM